MIKIKTTSARLMLTAILFSGLISALCSGTASAISDPENNGQWEKPAKSGPDKNVPGFLVNLGPTGARAILKERSFVVKYIFPGTAAARVLKRDDEIKGANGKPFSKHVFGIAYGVKSKPGLEGPIMDLGNAIEESEGD